MLNIAEAAAETGIVSFGISDFKLTTEEEQPSLKAAAAGIDDD